MNDILVPILVLTPILAIGIVLIMVVRGYYKITKWRADKKAELLQTQLLESMARAIFTPINQNQAKAWITIDPEMN